MRFTFLLLAVGAAAAVIPPIVGTHVKDVALGSRNASPQPVAGDSAPPPPPPPPPRSVESPEPVVELERIDSDSKCSVMCTQILAALDTYCNSTGSTSRKCAASVCPTVDWALVTACVTCYKSCSDTTAKNTQILAAQSAMLPVCEAYNGGTMRAAASTLNAGGAATGFSAAVTGTGDEDDNGGAASAASAASTASAVSGGAESSNGTTAAAVFGGAKSGSWTKSEPVGLVVVMLGVSVSLLSATV
ncbi:uncharacterized protein EHS24_008611 [Apiotrichum porosum]|uniref:Extracellular membrane protein CFEM domain-containing protein n=1 Tax=Apiotrichum porosum TaxID=105984 RepID=A0A427XQN6_9TREE|nr:uncharacterized protein EHS24_008611 [Apiotrichum porosum]RSH81174.1 hypothetical protein EHS24_008611 [Apiotrichum porosum]